MLHARIQPDDISREKFEYALKQLQIAERAMVGVHNALRIDIMHPRNYRHAPEERGAQGEYSAEDLRRQDRDEQLAPLQLAQIKLRQLIRDLQEELDR